ncbi:MAG: MmcB family DNA repair protein [Minwuia sp.]|uniref:MmcB family DNA repair protein n=1 Tax=Minwuia sp. TaxID=2493630 RepID=UPI003A851474
MSEAAEDRLYGDAIARGVMRLMAEHDRPSIREMTLKNGRRADVVALGKDGDIWIVEVKSSVADFRSDAKWGDYLEFCDRFFFAVPTDFPKELIPAECGLIVADAHGGAFLRDSPLEKLTAARRKAVTLRFARLAASRLLPPVGLV